MLRRLTRTYVPNQQFLDFVTTIQDASNIFSCMHAKGEPLSYKQAATDSNWVAAMKNKIASIQTNHTWCLAPCPPTVIPLHVKWIYKLKTDALGNLLRYKARLVARGDQGCLSRRHDGVMTS